ncbi:MAG: CDP-diacylglycerol--serine O-phosphatidyltransferase [Actinomycetota bacterium]|nr:CDP-diacylglycerol--serine O-phosphatidyltransferase [Actinomycetota bacterium]
MRGSLTAANLITSGNLAAGFLALILAEQGKYAWAATCVGVAAVLDSVDGLVARRTNTECELGSQLDSLADLVSFGVAPALLMYLSVLHSLPAAAGIGACLVFVLCGAWRLARFQTAEQSRRHFVGLPIPLAGVAAVALATWPPQRGFALAMLLALSLLMMSRLAFPTWAELVRPSRWPRPAAIEREPAGRKWPRSRPLPRRLRRWPERRHRRPALRGRPRARRG